jgi:hypothetical protein
MKSRREQPHKQVQLRQWTKKEITEHDFSFAVSSSKDVWNSLSHRLWQCKRPAAKKVVADMLHWEILREFKDNTCQAFLATKEHQERIKNVLDATTRPKPSEIEPLQEINLADAIKRHNELTQGVRSRISVHAFEIDRDERTEITEQQFHNWLVRYKQTPDHRRVLKQALDRLGRQSLDAGLRAIAVRRLKMAGYSREESESRLVLKRYALASPTDYWTKLPLLAEQKVSRYQTFLHEPLEV